MLLESSFTRLNNVVFDESVENDFNITSEVGVSEKVIIVTEEATIVQKNKDVEQVKIKVKFGGVFECVGESPITDLSEFGRINGAAIIYPYIREHVTSLSQKAEIGAIFLPPVNFTKTKNLNSSSHE